MTYNSWKCHYPTSERSFIPKHWQFFGKICTHKRQIGSKQTRQTHLEGGRWCRTLYTSWFIMWKWSYRLRRRWQWLTSSFWFYKRLRLSGSWGCIRRGSNESACSSNMLEARCKRTWRPSSSTSCSPTLLKVQLPGLDYNKPLIIATGRW